MPLYAGTNTSGVRGKQLFSSLHFVCCSGFRVSVSKCGACRGLIRRIRLRGKLKRENKSASKSTKHIENAS